MFVDEDRSTPLPGPLYQSAEDLSIFYMDEQLTERVDFVQPGELQTTAGKILVELTLIMTPNNFDVCNIKQDCSTYFFCLRFPPYVSDESDFPDTASSPTMCTIRPNDSFTKEHTLFLIEHMRIHVTNNGDMPKNLAELNNRLRKVKASKKLLWIETAAELSTQFNESFSPDKVARKWVTLVDAYKRIKDNQKSTGQGTIRFQFFKEMDALIGEQHDVSFPVTGNPDGVQLLRPDAVGKTTHSPFTSPASSESTVQPKSPLPPAASTSRKRRRADDVLEFLRNSEENALRRHTESMEKLQSAQDDFKSLMKELIQKM